MRPLFRNCIAGLALLPLAALADDGLPRYVSGSGQDTGDCLNKFRPCRSLSYAISKAGKGDVIQVAEGRYEVRTDADLSDLLTVQGRIVAGFDRHTGFSDRTASDKTVLVGVPPEMRERFEQAGFTVITDRKSLFETSQERKAREGKATLAMKVQSVEQRHGIAPCTGNQSAEFPCENVSLLAHLPLSALQPASSRGNDVWGFVDLNTGREYAFMGLQNGVAIVDVTDPTAPVQIAFASGSATTWRDIKIYQRYDSASKRWRAYAYATADNVQDYLMVLDLSGLPNSVERVSFTSDFRAAHNAYLVNADYRYGLAERDETPRLGISGSNSGSPRGSHRLYSLDQPRSPQLSSVSQQGYSHDLASHAIRDARKSAGCFNALTSDACEVLADFTEDSLEIWDVTARNSPQLLATHFYANRGYTHSGWWSEDGRYLFLHDELDEQNRGLNTTVRIFDLLDLRSPYLAGAWTGPTRAIDHNGFVKGNRYYISNYSEGLTVLDITLPFAPQRVGYFDTFPTGSPTDFVGAWGVYPFFESGTIAIGDINSGLYLLRNETLQSANGTLAFTARTATAQEGGQAILTITRTGGATSSVSVDIDLLHATASRSDVTLGTTTVSWNDNDMSPKTVTIDVAADGEQEGSELVIVRLKNPQGGATLNYPDAVRLHITEVGAATQLRFVDASVSVNEVRREVLVPVARTTSLAGAARVNYRTIASSAYSGFTATQGELNWAAGDVGTKLIRVELNPEALTSGQTGTFQIELHDPTGATLDGANVASALATVTVIGDGAAPQPNPSLGGGASNNRSGGGAITLPWLIALMLGASATALRRQLAS